MFYLELALTMVGLNVVVAILENDGKLDFQHNSLVALGITFNHYLLYLLLGDRIGLYVWA